MTTQQRTQGAHNSCWRSALTLLAPKSPYKLPHTTRTHTTTHDRSKNTHTALPAARVARHASTPISHHFTTARRSSCTRTRIRVRRVRAGSSTPARRKMWKPLRGTAMAREECHVGTDGSEQPRSSTTTRRPRAQHVRRGASMSQCRHARRGSSAHACASPPWRERRSPDGRPSLRTAVVPWISAHTHSTRAAPVCSRQPAQKTDASAALLRSVPRRLIRSEFLPQCKAQATHHQIHARAHARAKQ